VRLASLNILHGRSPDGSAPAVERLVEACASLRADVLCMQEVDRGQPRSGLVDQTEAVARGTGAAAWRFEPALVGEPGGQWVPATDADARPDAPASVAGYGIGTVSRVPVTRWHVVRLAAARVRSPVAVPGAGRGAFILLADEPRVVLAAEVEGPSGPLVVANTHLSFVPGWNAVQLRRLTRPLEALGMPCVLLGDINLPGPLPWWVSRWRPLAKVRTFPAERPSMQIDHALGHGDVPPVTGVAAVRLPISDHRALVVDVG
jgi:endonuclease/exonuclease/phosphatase family metal-dependent hydrolase